MPYCIVLTLEGSSQLISLVPSTWVKDNVLYWPRSKKNSDLELLRRNENTVPAENWKKIKCKVKVTGIDTFAEGLKLEDLYSKFEDTEDEERYEKNRETNRKHPVLKSVTADLLDLNANFDLIMEKQNTTMEKKETITEDKQANNHLEEDQMIENDPLTNYIVLQNIETNNVTKITNENNMTTNPDPVPEHNDLVTLKLDHLNELISQNSALSSANEVLKETIQRFQNLEQETKRGFAVMQIQLDKIFDLLKSKSFSNNDFTVEANTKNKDDMITQKNIEFPIKSVEQLDILENELMNADFEKALVKKFSKISGTSGTHKIGKIGLQITKSFFTDELLNHFTWKGIKGCSKPPFMQYINIRNCFYKIVHLADSACTSLEADSFLQNSAIKHSGQRIKRKLGAMNTSTSKKIRSETKKNTTINYKNVESYASNNIIAINNLDQEKEEVMNINLETTNIDDEEKEEEVMNINLEMPNIVDKVINTNLEMQKNPRKYGFETEDQLHEKENEIDDDTPDTKKYSIKASKRVTVLSDVKIKNKILDLKHESKIMNISSDNLHNVLCSKGTKMINYEDADKLSS